MPIKIMMIAGEASGDLHGGELVKALRRLEPTLEIFGVGGDSMKNAGMEQFYHIKQLAYIGFWEVAKHYGFFRSVFHRLVEEYEQRRPDILVLIDYPGFNLKFAQEIKKRGGRVFYYIAPQVWAWGRGRAKKMAKFIDHLAVLFDFEVSFFAEHGLPTTFVGHPLLDGLQTRYTRQEFCSELHIKPDVPLLALLPGSRIQEINSLLPTMLAAALGVKRNHPELEIVVSKAASIQAELIKAIVLETPGIHIVENRTYDLMKHATAALVASGTATLETACFATPFAIAYHVSPLSYAIGKRVVKIPHIGLANIVAGEQVAREFIQHDLTPDKVIPELENLLFDNAYRTDKITRLNKVKAKLGEPGSSEKTARLILQQLV
ncbi:MAG TPA: lipid-A-disaccharide synthase [bacterium]|nr:lipid-A-disaccharide synthase [bacterium]HPN44307.1 lipid-A-disaccharide synthase [bacterium]